MQGSIIKQLKWSIETEKSNRKKYLYMLLETKRDIESLKYEYNWTKYVIISNYKK